MAGTGSALPLNVTLSSGGVNSSLQNAQSASIRLQVYAHTLSQTPIIRLDPSIDRLSGSTVVSDLPAHQLVAQKNALKYIQEINPKIASMASDLSGFCNAWTSEYDNLLNLAQAIDKPGNKDAFKGGVTILISAIAEKQDRIAAVIADLGDFLADIEGDQRNLEQDSQNLTLALGGESGAIKQLKDSIAADHKAINADIAIITGGAVGVGLGVLMIVVGIAAEIFTAGASTAVVVGGIAVIGGGTAAMAVAGKDLASKQADLAKLSQTLALDQLCLASTTQATHTIASLNGAIADASDAVTNLQKGWAAVKGDLQQIVDMLDLADPKAGTWLRNVLVAANKDWTDSLSLAQGLEQYGKLDVQTVTYPKAA